MDHHCHWVNNCIGYSNYRSFFLTVFFLTLACWYGLLLCLPTIYTLWKQEQQYSTIHSQNHNIYRIKSRLYQVCQFLEIPHGSFQSLFFLLVGKQGQNMDPNMILKIVFYILFSFSFFLTPLLFTHVYLVCSAQTTLERIIAMDHHHHYHHLLSWTHFRRFFSSSWLIFLNRKNTKRYSQPESHVEKRTVIINPFDQGWKQNIKQILGESIYLLFIPIQVQIPKPFIPRIEDRNKKTN